MYKLAGFGWSAFAARRFVSRLKIILSWRRTGFAVDVEAEVFISSAFKVLAAEVAGRRTYLSSFCPELLNFRTLNPPCFAISHIS